MWDSDLKARIVAAGVATGDVFLGRLPDPVLQVRAVAVVPSAGLPDDWAFGAVLAERPAAQVFTREASYAAAETLARTAYQALRDVCNEVLGTTRYLRVYALQPPALFARSDASAADDVTTFVFNVQGEVG